MYKNVRWLSLGKKLTSNPKEVLSLSFIYLFVLTIYIFIEVLIYNVSGVQQSDSVLV